MYFTRVFTLHICIICTCQADSHVPPPCKCILKTRVLHAMSLCCRSAFQFARQSRRSVRRRRAKVRAARRKSRKHAHTHSCRHTPPLSSPRHFVPWSTTHSDTQYVCRLSLLPCSFLFIMSCVCLSICHLVGVPLFGIFQSLFLFSYNMAVCSAYVLGSDLIVHLSALVFLCIGRTYLLATCVRLRRNVIREIKPWRGSHCCRCRQCNKTGGAGKKGKTSLTLLSLQAAVGAAEVYNPTKDNGWCLWKCLSKCATPCAGSQNDPATLKRRTAEFVLNCSNSAVVSGMGWTSLDVQRSIPRLLQDLPNFSLPINNLLLAFTPAILRRPVRVSKLVTIRSGASFVITETYCTELTDVERSKPCTSAAG